MKTKTFIRKATMLFTLLLGISLITMAVDQQFKVTGKVTNAQGEPIAGATVKIKGTNTGAITDAEGNYTIYVTSKNVLEFSFIGMQTQKVQVKNQTVINVILQGEISRKSPQLQNQQTIPNTTLNYTKEQIIKSII
ncbi:carboxypeptidase-like regulatory domain-containing protein [Butyricimonas hominis]|uniref:carboxypeptidase-like regulatory domain-containing protein n=1 Tax=Butyricimonas TaxID=574697 RepID=UPI0035193359